MIPNGWLSDNFIEIFGAVTGILYVVLEIRQNLWLWPVGIVTSGVYIWIFFSGKFYADMSLQGYYLVISVLGWYWWRRGRSRIGREGETGGKSHLDKGVSPVKGNTRRSQSGTLEVTRLELKTGLILTLVLVLLFFAIWLILTNLTDSPVPGWDSFITSLSIIATWMLARKIFEHWYLWIVVNSVSSVIFLIKGLYPTVILYIIYCAMSFSGLAAWRRTIKKL